MPLDNIDHQQTVSFVAEQDQIAPIRKAAQTGGQGIPGSSQSAGQLRKGRHCDRNASTWRKAARGVTRLQSDVVQDGGEVPDGGAGISKPAHPLLPRPQQLLHLLVQNRVQVRTRMVTTFSQGSLHHPTQLIELPVLKQVQRLGDDTVRAVEFTGSNGLPDKPCPGSSNRYLRERPPSGTAWNRILAFPATRPRHRPPRNKKGGLLPGLPFRLFKPDPALSRLRPDARRACGHSGPAASCAGGWTWASLPPARRPGCRTGPFPGTCGWAASGQRPRPCWWCGCS